MDEKLTKKEWEERERDVLYHKFFNEIARTHSNTMQTIDKKLDSLNGYGKIYSFLKKDIGFVITALGFIISVITPYFLIKTDIALIRQNIETITKDITDSKNDYKIISQVLGEQNGRISKLEGIINKK